MFCQQTKLASFYLESPSGSEIEPKNWLNYVASSPSSSKRCKRIIRGKT